MQPRRGAGSISWEVLGMDAVEIGFAIKRFVSSNSSFRKQGRSPAHVLVALPRALCSMAEYFLQASPAGV